ncbi:hypothetical protein BDZ89DRAFT_39428 [Hymenopellis radicata]|nr:hypothetical protein BDZ89DRAFT_39428 [Hymenopellis radicata]
MANTVGEIPTGSTNTTLPQELIDSIIDVVAENGDTSFDDLKACSLTARRFRARTLCHLFLCLTARTRTRWPQFLELISESPHIPSHYTILKLVSHSRDVQRRVTATITLERVFASLVNIQVLWLHRYWGRVIAQPSLYAYVVAMPLKEVHLHFTLFRSVKEFAVFCKEALRGVRVVELEEPYLAALPEILDGSDFVAQDAPPVLRKLAVRHVKPAIVDAIAMGCIGPLRAVERLDYRGPNCLALTKFLDCRALKILVLEVVPDGGSEPLSTAGHFPCLECLTMDFGVGGGHRLLAWLIHCISSRRIGSHLKYLSFEGYLGRYSNLSPLTTFDQVMSENLAQFPALKGMTIPRGIQEIDVFKVYAPKLVEMGFISW